MSEGIRKSRRRKTGGRRQNACNKARIPASASSQPTTDGELRYTGFLVEVSPEAMLREKEKAGTLRKSQWWQRKLAKGECHYCHRKIAPADLTMDHLVPVVRGGYSTRGNVVPACKTCNNRKKYLLPTEWEEYLKGLANPSPSQDQS